MNLDSKKLAISPVSPFRPRRWKSKIVSDKSKIKIKNLNPQKRPIMAVADNVEIKNSKDINISINKKIIFKILYSKKNTLDKKIKIEQLEKKQHNFIMNNNSIKVTFVVPSWHYYADPLKHQPYWEMYYATYVKNAGYDVKIFDMRSENNSIDIITRMQEIEELIFTFGFFKTGDAKEIYSISTYLKKIS